MRELSEINIDIEETKGKISFFKAQLANLIEERCERKFATFCENRGLKKGDIVSTNHYGDVQIVGYDTRFDWIICRKIKKNGEPYASTTTMQQSCFDGCRIIGYLTP